MWIEVEKLSGLTIIIHKVIIEELTVKIISLNNIAGLNLHHLSLPTTLVYWYIKYYIIQ